MSTTVKVFDNAYLSDVGSDYVSEQVSHAIPVAAENVKLHGTLINGVGSNFGLELHLQGSYDGQVWQTTGLTGAGKWVNLAVPPQASANTSVAYAFVRVRASVETEGVGDGKALFDAEIVFSQQ